MTPVHNFMLLFGNLFCKWTWDRTQNRKNSIHNHTSGFLSFTKQRTIHCMECCNCICANVRIKKTRCACAYVWLTKFSVAFLNCIAFLISTISSFLFIFHFHKEKEREKSGLFLTFYIPFVFLPRFMIDNNPIYVV